MLMLYRNLVARYPDLKQGPKVAVISPSVVGYSSPLNYAWSLLLSPLTRCLACRLTCKVVSAKRSPNRVPLLQLPSNSDSLLCIVLHSAAHLVRLSNRWTHRTS